MKLMKKLIAIFFVSILSLSLNAKEINKIHSGSMDKKNQG